MLYHKHARLSVAINRIAKKNRLATTIVDSVVAPAWGTVSFSANPATSATITINGTVIALTSLVGATLADTLTAVEDHIAANPITGVASVGVNGDGLLVLSDAPGDTSITLAVSSAVGSVSAATLQAQKVRSRQPLSNVTVTP